MTVRLRICGKPVNYQFVLVVVILGVAVLSFTLPYQWFDEIQLSTGQNGLPRILPTSISMLQSTVAVSNVVVPRLKTTHNEDIVIKNIVKPNSTPNYINDLHFHFGFGRLDGSRRYRIHEHVVNGDRWPATPANHAVCLVSLYSVGYLHHLMDLLSAWNGIVSVSLWTPDVDLHIALRYIQFLRGCYASVRDNSSFHVVYPVQNYPTPSLPFKESAFLKGYNLSSGIACEDHLKKLTQLKHKHRWYESERDDLIPQNLLRNVARKTCPTDYIFVVDGDLIPRDNLSPRLTYFLSDRKQCYNCVYIIPAYEMSSSGRFPENKKELMELIRKGKAQPFRKKVSLTNKEIANYKRWERLTIVDSLNAPYEMKGFADIAHDHFYVSFDNVPAYDERFVGYGYTRNTQAYEMQLAGFKMWVLDTDFLIHKTMEFNETKTFSETRINQIKANADRMADFRREMEAKYSKLRLVKWTKKSSSAF